LEKGVSNMTMPKKALQDELRRFLSEDVGQGDITTNSIVPQGINVRAEIIVKEHAVICGIFEAKVFFEMLGVNFTAKVQDGDEVSAGTIIAKVEGDGRLILTAERTVLNILMRMSGIATETRRLVKEVQKSNLKVRIAATRKTAPGLRYFDKRAVTVGGGEPHRMRLDEAFLIKDNHITISGGIEEAVKKARSSRFSKKIEVEAKTREQAIQAARMGADIVMLDNMTQKEAGETIKELATRNLREKVLIEISGGVTQANLISYARLEPDIISLGSLTHSVKAVDISLEVVEVKASK
jgi:nicotinate-nucleotide pyrophosphorylase (carboxylating)